MRQFAKPGHDSNFFFATNISLCIVGTSIIRVGGVDGSSIFGGCVDCGSCRGDTVGSVHGGMVGDNSVDGEKRILLIFPPQPDSGVVDFG